MIDVDKFLDRLPSGDYKCWDFVREVWRESFGVDVGDKLASLVGALKDRKIVLSELRGCTRIDKPVDPCFVVMHRKRTEPHIGIWTGGEVLNLTGNGVVYDKLKFVSRTYGKVSFYLP